MLCSNRRPLLRRAGLWVMAGGLLMALSACGESSAPLAEPTAPPVERQVPVMRCAPASGEQALAVADGCVAPQAERRA